jgi:hypothetical protein
MQHLLQCPFMHRHAGLPCTRGVFRTLTQRKWSERNSQISHPASRQMELVDVVHCSTQVRASTSDFSTNNDQKDQKTKSLISSSSGTWSVYSTPWKRRQKVPSKRNPTGYITSPKRSISMFTAVENSKPNSLILQMSFLHDTFYEVLGEQLAAAQPSILLLAFHRVPGPITVIRTESDWILYWGRRMACTHSHPVSLRSISSSSTTLWP